MWYSSKPDSLDEDEFPDVRLHDLDVSWFVWMWMEKTNWSYPPDIFLRQPEWLLEDLETISFVAGRVRESVSGNR